ncbi:MAG: hypothetical protein M3499_04315 [Actinomycetota bacterium]|nr:hypothetical protein [Actinomycetota bacterium]
MSNRKTEDAGRLYDFAVRHPDGFTYVDVGRDFGWSRVYFYAVVRVVRSVFAGDAIALVCTPPTTGSEPWLYELVSTYDAARPWAVNRIGDMESRLDTVHGVASSLTNATDGRTMEGRKVRKIESTVGYLLRELADINDQI